MGFFLSPLFSTVEAQGCILPSLGARGAYVELISFAFPYTCTPLLTPARPAAGCPWCCWARRAALLPAVTPAALTPSPGTQQQQLPFLLAKQLEEQNGPVPGSSSWTSQLRHDQLGETAPEQGKTGSSAPGQTLFCQQGKGWTKFGGWML